MEGEGHLQMITEKVKVSLRLFVRLVLRSVVCMMELNTLVLRKFDLHFPKKKGCS